MQISQTIASQLSIQLWQVEATIKLIDEGNTIPFIARYRKEVTGNLNDEVLRSFDEKLKYYRNINERKETIVKSLQQQGVLTDALLNQLENVDTMVALEDIYRPFKPKKRTRATIAKEKGLAGLAEVILQQENKEPLTVLASKYVDLEKGVKDVKEAIAGASDIIAEEISENAQYRKELRQITYDDGIVLSLGKTKEDSVYSNYYSFNEKVSKIAPHRILAINRGEAEKFLTVSIVIDSKEIYDYLFQQVIKKNSVFKEILEDICCDSYERLIAPSIERDIRNELTEKAEDQSILVFGQNLKQLLMQKPLIGHTVLGWDPAFRTGCKLAVVDPTCKVLSTKVIYPTAPQNKVAESKKIVKEMIDKYHIDIISLGNGTASRESEAIIVDMIREYQLNVKYVIVNEAGASVYSASKLATEEFPEFDVGQRSATSMARRLQDPLAELVKIDPKSIGVGQYQHDMNQKKLDESLATVVEDCVNSVGVDLNTASASLLEYVSGINKTLAKNIVTYREENGRFTNRKQLLKVAKLGPKAYQQAAGFLRVYNGNEPLDTTSVHPESYQVTYQMLNSLGISSQDILHGGLIDLRRKTGNIYHLSEQLGIGALTLEDIINALEKPSRDPREDAPDPILKSDVLTMEDLKEGMILQGTVRNIIDFGAFVDIGVHQDGLVHISKMSNRYIKHPMEVVSVGDIVKVKVLSVDVKKKKIALSMLI